MGSDPDVARLIMLLDLKRSLIGRFLVYDPTLKYGIMKDIHGLSLRRNLPIFIAIVFKDRSFKVRVGSTFCDSHLQEMGVPQGSILSVTLFFYEN